MKVFAYVQRLRCFLPRVVYVPIDNANKNDLKLFKELSVKMDTPKFGRILNVIKFDDDSITEPRMRVWNAHSEDAPHRFSDDFHNDPDFKDSISYFPWNFEQNMSHEELTEKFLSSKRIKGVDIEVVDHVVVFW